MDETPAAEETKEISIPVLRGEVQLIKKDVVDVVGKFQFPYCVGKFNAGKGGDVK